MKNLHFDAVALHYDWGDLVSDDEVHQICKPFDPDVFDDCPDERPDHYDDPVDPNLLLDEDIVPLRTQPTVKRRRGLTLEQVFVLPPPVWQIDQCNWGVILTLGV